MKLFRDYTMAWWQVGLLKACVFVAGLLAGSYFVDVVSQYVTLLLSIFLALALYLVYSLFTGGFDSHKN